MAIRRAALIALILLAFLTTSKGCHRSRCRYILEIPPCPVRQIVTALTPGKVIACSMHWIIDITLGALQPIDAKMGHRSRRVDVVALTVYRAWRIQPGSVGSPGEEPKVEIVGKVESLWRYPVKSMRGEVLEQAFVGFSGIYGDRIFAVRSSAQPVGLPYLTGREQEQMLLYSPRFRDPEKAAKPVNLAEAERMAPGITPLFADEEDLAVTVETPDGAELGIDDPALLQKLGEGVDGKHRLTLLR